MAFVSTNSITQGVQVPDLWIPMLKKYGVHINFAYTTFRWDSEASIKANVACVIIGFSIVNRKTKIIYTNEHKKRAKNISPYLIDSPDIIVERRMTPLADVSEIILGNMPKDGGGFILTENEYAIFREKEPQMANRYAKEYIGAEEFINSKKRYCLWLVNADPNDIKKSETIYLHVNTVKQYRLSSRAESTVRLAETPTLFAQIVNQGKEYILIPRVSSERRRYVPMGYLPNTVIASDAVQIVPEATIYEFGILTSNVHMAWMRAVCGRLESRYRYSKDIVYNTFPWPNPNKKQIAQIEKSAKNILMVRSKYKNTSLADLYDDASMPPDLRKAHQINDIYVMEAYGFKGKIKTESECVAELMRMYQELTKKD